MDGAKPCGPKANPGKHGPKVKADKHGPRASDEALPTCACATGATACSIASAPAAWPPSGWRVMSNLERLVAVKVVADALADDERTRAL